MPGIEVEPTTSFRLAPGAAELDLTRCARAGLEQSSRFIGRQTEGKTWPDWLDLNTRPRSARLAWAAKVETAFPARPLISLLTLAAHAASARHH